MGVRIMYKNFKFTGCLLLLFFLVYSFSVFLYFAVGGGFVSIFLCFLTGCLLATHLIYFHGWLNNIFPNGIRQFLFGIYVSGFSVIFFIGKENSFIADYYFFIMISLICFEALLLIRLKKDSIFLVLPIVLIILFGLL